MTLGGWVIMTLLVGGITVLLAWCIHRVMSESQATRKIHSPADIDTHDAE